MDSDSNDSDDDRDDSGSDGSGSNESDYDENDSDDNNDDLDDENDLSEEDDSREDLQAAKEKNIQFLQEMSEFVKAQVSKVDSDLESAKNKKKGGTLKKQKEKVGALNYKLGLTKKFKDRIDELI